MRRSFAIPTSALLAKPWVSSLFVALWLAAAAGQAGAAAARYWVGPINGDWTDAANWSATPGGPGGAGAPTAQDQAIGGPGSGGSAGATSVASSPLTQVTLGPLRFSRAYASAPLVSAGSVSSTGETAFLTGGVTPNDLKPDSDIVLSTSDTTGTVSIHSLTFSALKGPVDLTQAAGSTLTITGVSPTSGFAITKNGTFDSVLTGGQLVSGTGLFSIQANGGLLTIGSALNGAGSRLTVSGSGGTVELTSTKSTFDGGIGIGSAATLRITDDLNLGVTKDGTPSVNFVNLSGGTLEVFNNPVTLGPARYINVNVRSGGTLMITGDKGELDILGKDQLRGTGPLTKDGLGTLVIGSSNVYSGPFTLLKGGLELQDPNALGSDIKSAIDLQAGGTFSLRSDATTLNFNNDVTLDGNALISFNRLVSTKAGDFFLNDLTFTADPKGGQTTAFLGTTNGKNVLHFTGLVSLGNDGLLNVGAGAVSLDGSTQGLGALTKTGPGALLIRGTLDNRYSQPTTVLQGLVSLGKTDGRVAIPSDLTINGGVVRLDANDQISDASTISLLQGTFNVNSRKETSSYLVNSGGTVLTGGGTLILNGGAIGAPAPAPLPGGPLGAAPVAALVISGGTTTIASGGEINATSAQVSGGVNTAQAGGGTLTIGSGGLTLAGDLSPNFTFESDDVTPGHMSLVGNVTYTGLNGTASLTTVGVGGKNGYIDLNAAERQFNVGGDGAGGPDLMISADIMNGSVRKLGTGLLRLTGNNKYTGVTISAGTLEVSGPGALGGGNLTIGDAQLNVHSDAVPTLTNGITSIGSSILNVDRDTALGGTSGEVVFSGPLSIGVNPLTIAGANRTVQFTGLTTMTASAKISNAIDVRMSGAIGQSAAGYGLTKDNTAKMTFDGAAANTYTGTTRVNLGTLELNKTPGVNAIPANLDVFGTVRLLAANQIADASAVTVNGASATLDLNGNSERIASLGGAGGKVTLGGGVLTVGGGTFNGVISGAGSVVQDSAVAGTLTLTPVQTFTGGVTVKNGTVTFSALAPGLTAGGSLNGGVWQVFNGSQLNFVSGPNPNITTNQTQVTLSGAGSTFPRLNTIATNGGTGVLSILAGNSFAASGALANAGQVTVGAGSALTVNGGYTNTGTTTASGTFTGGGVINTSGTLTLSGPQSYQVGTTMNVSGGTTTLNTDTGSPAAPRLSISATGGTLQLNATQHLAGLVVSGEAILGTPAAAPLPEGSPSPLGASGLSAGSMVLMTKGVTTLGSGTLDIANNSLIVDYTGGTPITSVRGAIVSAYNAAGTHWTGAGITSSTAATQAGAYGVGFAEASGALNIGGAQTAPYLGETVDATAVLVRFTKLGDATLDGVVDFNDLVKLAQNYNVHDGARTWFNGDFTYDGNVDFNDLVKLAQNYNTALASDAIPGASAAFEADLARAFAQVPEPSSMGVLLVAVGAALSATGRRRRRRRIA